MKFILGIVSECIPAIRVIEFIIIIILAVLWIIKRKKTFRKLEIGILIFQIILFLLVACAFHEAHSPNPRFRCAQAYDCGAPDPNTGMSTCKYCEENVDEYDYTSLCVKEKEITCVVNNTTKTTTTTRISND